MTAKLPEQNTPGKLQSILSADTSSSLQKKLQKLFKNKKILLVLLVIIFGSLIGGYVLLKGEKVSLLLVDNKKEQLPLITFPKPFEPGYFPGLLNPEIIANFNDIEITGDAKPVVFHYPADGFVARTILVKNTGKEEAVVAFRPKIDVPNYDEQFFINHPQPSRVYLDPGESYPIRLAYTLQAGGPSALSWKKGDKKDAPITVDFELWRNNGSSNEPFSKSIKLNNTIEVIGESGPNYRDPQANAVVTGKVVDQAGKLIANVPIEVVTGRGRPVEIKTDTSGTFKANVYAFQRGGTNQWSEITVVANQPQNQSSIKTLGQDTAIFPLKTDEERVIKLMLESAPKRARYDLKNTIDLGWQGYGWDATDNGDVMVTVPFHTVAQPGILEKEGVLTIFNKDGEVLGKVQTNGETPTVDVSTDGSMIAMTKGYDDGSGSHWGGKPVLIDSTGKIIKEIDIPKETHFWWGIMGDRATSVAISDDNKYLAVGDQFGRLFLVEIASGKIIWEKFTKGQVRRLEFDANSQMRLFASSGDGYLRAFDTQGTVVWKTFVDAWLTDMDISTRYIVATSKAGRGNIHLIEKDSGETLWSYPVEQRGSGIKISPDESFVWYGTDVGIGNTPLISAVWNIKGQPLFETSASGQGGAFTADSKYLVVKSPQRAALFNRDGQLLWQKNIAGSGDVGAMNHLAWISADAKKIVVGLNSKPEQRAAGQIYILEGSFIDPANAIDSFEMDRQPESGQPPGGGQNPPPQSSYQPGENQPQNGVMSGGKCGDNICDAFETSNPNACPIDCDN